MTYKLPQFRAVKLGSVIESHKELSQYKQGFLILEDHSAISTKGFRAVKLGSVIESHKELSQYKQGFLILEEHTSNLAEQSARAAGTRDESA